MTHTIMEMKRELVRSQSGLIPYWITGISELLDEVESLTRQLRAEEITGLNMRLRTARECAECLDSFGHDVAARAIRLVFEVPA